MNELSKIVQQKVTLVDQVEQSLIQYFKDRGLKTGDVIPGESELTDTLGVGRTVVREALSRLKMLGMVESRTRRGMVLAEPSLLVGMERCLNPLLMSDQTLRDIMEFRVSLEVGISGILFRNITQRDIDELEQIVGMGVAIGRNKYAPDSEYRFHTKLYEITGNKFICEFQSIIHPVLEFVKLKHRDSFEPIERELLAEGRLVTHEELFEFISRRDEVGYKRAIEEHFRLYTIYLERQKKKIS